MELPKKEHPSPSRMNEKEVSFGSNDYILFI
jgi:hypothetical protein